MERFTVALLAVKWFVDQVGLVRIFWVTTTCCYCDLAENRLLSVYHLLANITTTVDNNSPPSVSAAVYTSKLSSMDLDLKEEAA